MVISDAHKKVRDYVRDYELWRRSPALCSEPSGERFDDMLKSINAEMIEEMREAQKAVDRMPEMK